MPIYHSPGQIPRKRHTAMPRATGGVHHEQLMGNHGFTGPSSLLYHLRRPTAVREVSQLAPVLYEVEPELMLRARHLRTARIERGGSPTLDRLPLLVTHRLHRPAGGRVLHRGLAGQSVLHGPSAARLIPAESTWIGRCGFRGFCYASPPGLLVYAGDER